MILVYDDARDAYIPLLVEMLTSLVVDGQQRDHVLRTILGAWVDLVHDALQLTHQRHVGQVAYVVPLYLGNMITTHSYNQIIRHTNQQRTTITIEEGRDDLFDDELPLGLDGVIEVLVLDVLALLDLHALINQKGLTLIQLFGVAYDSKPNVICV